uniref:Uncharacterized protein n=1 Tax=Pipistrellus kuhlii TaxID=59472 RepID=A0A7J7YX52_PIPKU|nr:hypothetical protein mPipKuh1_009886 [Pipistrellus kuhlii]
MLSLHLEAQYDLNRPMAICHLQSLSLRYLILHTVLAAAGCLSSGAWLFELDLGSVRHGSSVLKGHLILKADVSDEFAKLHRVLDFLKRSEGHGGTLLLGAPGHQPNSPTVTCRLHTVCVVCSVALLFS